MLLVMNTENTRVLASTYEERSDGALNLQFTLNQNLALAALDDTYDVSGSLTALSEELHLGGVVLAHQADIMDGLTVDVDALAEDLKVQPWEIRQQLDRAAKGKIDLGDVLAPIVNWGDATTVGLDTTIRDFVPNAPEVGFDPEFDQLIQRLDGWLLAVVVDGRPLDQLLTTVGREADALALATRLGMQDLSTVTVTFEQTRWEGNSDDGRNVTTTHTRPLDPDEYHGWTLDWLTPKLTDERKLSRVGVVPSIGELFDLTILHYTVRRKRGGGDEDYETVNRTRQRSAAEIAEEVKRLNVEFTDLAWLPAVLAGRAQPPPGALTPAAQERLAAFAAQFGFSGDVVETTDALTYLTDSNLIANALENPRPIQKARLSFAAGALNASIDLGRRQGVVTADHEAEARRMAQYLTGFDPNLGLDTITAEELEAVAPEIDIQEFVGLLASRISPEQLTENRIIQALTYVKRGKSVGDRIERIEQAVLGLQTVTTVGEPAMTKHDWLTSLPAKVRDDDQRFDTDIESEEFNWLLAHSGIPGYHKSRDWRSGKGKRYFHLVNDDIGKVDDFIVEVIPKKQGWFGKVLMSAAKIAVSIVAPPVGVAIAVMDAAIAAEQGDWLAAGIGALGALTAGTAAWASSTASAASTATANAVKAADAVRAGTGTAAALTTANQAFTAANSAANLANVAASGAQAVSAGVRAGVAFANDDLVGGLVGSVGALAAGANGFGYSDVATNLTRVGQGIQGVDTAVRAIEDDDIAGALAGGLGAGAAFGSVGANAAAGLGAIGAQTNQTLQRVATTAQSTAGLVGSGSAIVRGIEEEQWGALVGQGLRFGSSTVDLVADQNGIVSGLVHDRADKHAFAASTRDLQKYAAYGAVAADFADGGLAIANEDYLGGAALISGGTTALIKDTKYESRHFTRLDQLTSIADKVVKAGPDVDHETLMGLIGSDVVGFVETFREQPEQVALRPGDPAETLGAVRAERRATEASIEVLDNLLALGSGNATTDTLLQAQKAQLTSDLELLTREQVLAEEVYVVTTEASRPGAPDLPSHIPAMKPPLPSHIPALKPPLPGHIPVFRPEDLFGVRAADGLPVPGPHGTFLPTPPMAIEGAPGPGRPGRLTFDDFPADHQARIYQDWVRLGHPAQITPDALGDWNVELAGVAPAFSAGPYKVPLGALGVLGFGQETFADGRKGIGYNLKYGTRMGVDGPVPMLPGLQVGFSHDNLTALPDWQPFDVPLGGWTFQSIGGTPGVPPNEMYDLANPLLWPEGASVRLNEFTGDEYHWKIGNSGPARASLFGDEIRHDLDFFQVTKQGERVEIAQGLVDVNATQPGFAFNLALPDSFLGIPLPEELRFAASHQFVNGSASLAASHYGVEDHTPYMTHHLNRAPAPDDPVTYIDAEFGSQQGWFDLTTGKASPKFDTSLNVAKLAPHSQWFVANSLQPDGTRTSDFSTGGWFWNRASGRTTTGPDGSIDSIEITSAITPPFGDEIPFTLDTDDYIAFLEAEQFGRDPIEALRGRPNIPDKIFANPLTRHEMLDTLHDIQEMRAYDELNPHPGNLSVRENHHGGKRLEMTNPYPGVLMDGIAADYPFLNIKNRPIVNHQIRADEVMNGIGKGLGIVWADIVDGAKYAHYGTAYGGVKLAETLGLGDWVGEPDRANAAVFEQRYLDNTIEAGRQAIGYVTSRAGEPRLLSDDAVAFDDAVDDWVATTKEAWRAGDGEYFGRGIAYAGAGGAGALAGVGAPALAAKGASKLGQVASRLGGSGRGGKGGGTDFIVTPNGGVFPTDGAIPRRTTSGSVTYDGDGRRVTASDDRIVLEPIDDGPGPSGWRPGSGGPDEHKPYVDELIDSNVEPPVLDPHLQGLWEKRLYKPDATVGNRSPAAAATEELMTGVQVGNRWHHQKSRDLSRHLEDWLEQNPDASRGDRYSVEVAKRQLDRYLQREFDSPTPHPNRGDDNVSHMSLGD